MHSKDETLAFLGYLMNKKNIIMDSERRYVRTFFNSSIKNIFEYAIPLRDIIQHADSVGDAYRNIAHFFAKQNSLWKEYRETAFIFAEDLIALMDKAPKDDLSDGQSDVQSLAQTEVDLLKALSLEKYSDCQLDKRLSATYRPWLANGITLRSRDIIFESFPTEYLYFHHEYYETSEETFSVQERTVEGKYYGTVMTAGKWEKFMDDHTFKTVTGTNQIFVGYDSMQNDMDRQTMISTGKILCNYLGLKQVTFMDYASRTAIVVQKI